MKAIILAAGQGERLRPLTDDRPKCMVEYRGKPIIDHILGAMKIVGITDLILVKGYCAETLQRNGTQSVINHRYFETNMVASLFCSEPFWDDDLIISYADIVYEPRILQALVDEPSDFAIVIDKDWKKLWEQRMSDPLLDAETLKLDHKGYVQELGKKPTTYDDIEGQYIGLIKIKKSLLARIKILYDNLDRQAKYDGKNFDGMYMTSFLQLMIEHNMPAKAVCISGGWVEIDTLEDLNVLCQ